MKFKAVIGSVALATTALMTSACGSSGSSGPAVKSGCKPAHHFHTVQKGYLTFAFVPYAPAAMLSGNQLVGIEGDLLDKVTAMECLQLKIANFTNASIIPAVQTGRADLTGTDEYRTAARQKVVNQSLPLYLDRMVLVSKGGVVKTIPQLLHERVGTPSGNLWNADLDKFLGGHLKVYSSFSDAYQDLADGRINVVVDGALGASQSTKNLPNMKSVVPPPNPAIGASEAPGQADWPTNKNNPELTNALNADILILRKDGDIVAALKRYHLDPALAHVGKPNLL
jgi:polar amino acid transport system substrate-binding protein